MPQKGFNNRLLELLRFVYILYHLFLFQSKVIKILAYENLLSFLKSEYEYQQILIFVN